MPERRQLTADTCKDIAPDSGLLGMTDLTEVTACAKPLDGGETCVWYAGHTGPCSPPTPPEYYDNMAATEPVKAAMRALSARLVPPARLGFRCTDNVVRITLYRSALHDQEGLYCAEGMIGYGDGTVSWFHKVPGDVLAPDEPPSEGSDA